MNVTFYLSYDIKITLKSHFWRKNIIILSLYTHAYYGRHNVTRKSVNHFFCEVDLVTSDLSGLIWVQTVCKGYQHTTLVFFL